MTKHQRLVHVRAHEDVAEFGSIAEAIARDEYQIATSDIPAERRFMRQVVGYLYHLLTVANSEIGV